MAKLPKFIFDPTEGLDDFLTPVYFEKEVLIKYVYDKSYGFSFASETYGTIYFYDRFICFGINSQDHVIAWHGDLQELEIEERFHWKSKNIASDHDMRSEFFEAQINATFTDNPLGVRFFDSLEKLNFGFTARFHVPLYKARSFEQRREEVQKYRKIVINRKEDFIGYLSELNSKINENINNQGLRELLSEKKVEFSVNKGNKLLQQIYENLLGDKQNLIAPFFYLYDLRLWANHSLGDERLQEVCRRLKVADINNYNEIFTKLLRELEKSSIAINALVEAATN